MRFRYCFLQPNCECERAASILIFDDTRSSIDFTCGPNVNCLSRMTPRSLGVTTYLIAFPSITMFGENDFASLVAVVK